MKRILFTLAFLLLSSQAAFAAPAVVQCTAKQSANNVTTANASFSSTPAVNNIIFVVVGAYVNSGSGGVASIADNQSNSYAVDIQKIAMTGQSANIGSAKAATSSGTFTVTVTMNSTASVLDWAICEVSGLATASWKDQTGSAEAVFTDPVVVTASGANSQNSEIVFAVAAPTSGTISGTPSSGYTDIYTDNASTGSRASYKIINGAETSSASFPYAAAIVAEAVISTNKAAGGGGATLKGSLMLLGVGQ